MHSTFARVVALTLGFLVIFGAVITILFAVMPGPYAELDYFVIGAVATLVSLLALFFILVATWAKSSDIFFKRRRQPGPE